MSKETDVIKVLEDALIEIENKYIKFKGEEGDDYDEGMDDGFNECRKIATDARLAASKIINP